MNLPKRVTIELTNDCNRNCPECPRHKMTYPYGYMEPDLFSQIIVQLPSDTTIVPFFRGESLKHPDFPELMTQLWLFNNIQLASNGDLLDHRNQIAILNSCSFFSLSLHGFQMPWQTKQLPFFHVARTKGIETQVSIIDTQVPESKKKRFIREWQKHVDRVRIYKTHSIQGLGDMPNEYGVEACKKPFEETVVYWDGKVGLCNHDWNNRTLLGDLNEQSIEEVWDGENYQATRFIHTQGKRDLVPSCRECSFQNKLYGELYQRQ